MTVSNPHHFCSRYHGNVRGDILVRTIIIFANIYNDVKYIIYIRIE